MTVPFHVIIPARFASSRLPGKLLMSLEGQTVIERVYRQALLAQPLSVLVATDDEAIYREVERFGGQAMMTSADHVCGTDRIVEVVERQGFAPKTIIVNVQGDEPLIDPQLITQVAEGLHASQHAIYTVCWPVASLDELHNLNVVKVVMNQRGSALYFSRSPIPCHRDDATAFTGAYRHIGLYAYRSQFLHEWLHLPACPMEAAEALEPLRALYAGHSIGIEVAVVPPMQDINTASDLDAARAFLQSK